MFSIRSGTSQMLLCAINVKQNVFVIRSLYLVYRRRERNSLWERSSYVIMEEYLIFYTLEIMSIYQVILLPNYQNIHMVSFFLHLRYTDFGRTFMVIWIHLLCKHWVIQFLIWKQSHLNMENLIREATSEKAIARRGWRFTISVGFDWIDNDVSL